MSNTINTGDFIEVIYTGSTNDGVTFDTNVEAIAKEKKIFSAKQKYDPVKICVGEHQILEGIDQSLNGKELGQKFTLNIPAELGFGKRDVKKVQLVPMTTFDEHKVKPFKGLQVDFDGQIGVVQRISGGRVMVNFNDPLSGKELVYDVEVLKKITDTTEQAKAYISHIMPIKPEHLDISVKDKTLVLCLPFDLPDSFREAMTEKFQKVLSDIEKVEFTKKLVDLSKENPTTLKGEHTHGPNCHH